MKKCKKITAIVMAVVMCAVMGTVAASAQTTDVDLSHTVVNEPVYTISVPRSLDMDKNGSDFTFAVDESQFLDGKKISVTIAGTDYFRNQMILEDESTRKTLRYQIVTANGTTLETTGGKDQMVGQEVASFTADGTSTCKFVPVYAINTVPGNYTGTITFNINVVNAQ